MNKAKIIEKIKELIEEAPEDWAKQIAKLMNCSEESVYAYARGDRGSRTGNHKTVLEHLKTLVDQENRRLKKLLA
jgi:predicted transcriptional regulator